MSSVSARIGQRTSTIVRHATRLFGLVALTSLLAVAIASANLPLLGRDFLLFWTSARAVQDGYSPYVSGLKTSLTKKAQDIADSFGFMLPSKEAAWTRNWNGVVAAKRSG